MRMRLLLGGCLLLPSLACAKIEPPPGGPPDLAPPHLVATRPESLARIPDFSGDVEFRFDEVISEADVAKLVIISPSVRTPHVDWRRTRITVKPDEGWRPNRVYRVELLPGVTDLRRNRSKEGRVVTFTTDAPLPTHKLEGLVVDWTTSRPAPLALVEALLVEDSLPYRGLADSSGRFSLGPLPDGEYLVKGVIDQNDDFRPGEREAFDSVRVAASDSTVGELWTFVHDTAPARIRAISVADSVTATVEFNQFLDPRQRLDSTAATLRLLPDSSPVKIASLLPKPIDDSVHGRGAGTKDSTARDSTARERPGLREVERPGAAAGAREEANRPLTTRPPLSDRLVLRVIEPWKPETKYELELRGIRNVSGVAGDARGVLTVPKHEVRDSLRTAKDSLRTLKDSLRTVKDSLRRP
jgi:Big-like domain-containing protein